MRRNYRSRAACVEHGPENAQRLAWITILLREKTGRLLGVLFAPRASWHYFRPPQRLCGRLVIELIHLTIQRRTILRNCAEDQFRSNAGHGTFPARTWTNANETPFTAQVVRARNCQKNA